MSSKIDFTENASSPDTPSAGKLSLYAKDDKSIYIKDDTGTETDLTSGGGGGAPTDATYILQVADGDLANAQALGALGTGVLKNTTTTGVLSIATASDIPDLPASKITSGELPVARGGTGVATLTDGGLLRGEGTANVSSVSGSNTGDTVYWDGSQYTNILSTSFLLASGTLGSAQASIAISSIPATWQNLQLVLSIRGVVAAATDNLRVQFNSDTTAGNYFGQEGSFLNVSIGAAPNNGTVATIAATGSSMVPAATAPSNSFGVAIFDILDYKSTTRIKTSVGRVGNRLNTGVSGNALWQTLGIWNSTAAIASIQISLAGGNIASGSTYALYGLSS